MKNYYKWCAAILICFSIGVISGCNNASGELSASHTTLKTDQNHSNICITINTEVEAAASSVEIPSDSVSYFRQRQELQSGDFQDEIAATVNGSSVFMWVVKQGVLDSEIQAENTRKQVEQMELSAEQKQEYLDGIALKSEKDVLETKIRAEVVRQLVAQEVESVSEEEAMQEAVRNLQAIKEALVSDNASERQDAAETYGELKAAYVAYEMSEEEYVQKISQPFYKELMNNQRLFEKFQTSLSDTDQANAESLFNAYIDQAVANADVKIVMDLDS